jgi:hypothetical protein
MAFLHMGGKRVLTAENGGLIDRRSAANNGVVWSWNSGLGSSYLTSQELEEKRRRRDC